MGVVRSREQFLHCGLRKFRHSKSSVDRWYTQLDGRRFVYDTYKTMKATCTCHSWVHMFITHRPTLTLQLHNFDLFRTCRTVAWQLARFQLTRCITRSIGNSWASCYVQNMLQDRNICTLWSCYGSQSGWFSRETKRSFIQGIVYVSFTSLMDNNNTVCICSWAMCSNNYQKVMEFSYKIFSWLWFNFYHVSIKRSICCYVSVCLFVHLFVCH